MSFNSSCNKPLNKYDDQLQSELVSYGGCPTSKDWSLEQWQKQVTAYDDRASMYGSFGICMPDIDYNNNCKKPGCNIKPISEAHDDDGLVYRHNSPEMRAKLKKVRSNFNNYQFDIKCNDGKCKQDCSNPLKQCTYLPSTVIKDDKRCPLYKTYPRYVGQAAIQAAIYKKIDNVGKLVRIITTLEYMPLANNERANMSKVIYGNNKITNKFTIKDWFDYEIHKLNEKATDPELKYTRENRRNDMNDIFNDLNDLLENYSRITEADRDTLINSVKAIYVDNVNQGMQPRLSDIEATLRLQQRGEDRAFNLIDLQDSGLSAIEKLQNAAKTFDQDGNILESLFDHLVTKFNNAKQHKINAKREMNVSELDDDEDEDGVSIMTSMSGSLDDEDYDNILSRVLAHTDFGILNDNEIKEIKTAFKKANRSMRVEHFSDNSGRHSHLEYEKRLSKLEQAININSAAKITAAKITAAPNKLVVKKQPESSNKTKPSFYTRFRRRSSYYPKKSSSSTEEHFTMKNKLIKTKNNIRKLNNNDAIRLSNVEEAFLNNKINKSEFLSNVNKITKNTPSFKLGEYIEGFNVVVEKFGEEKSEKTKPSFWSTAMKNVQTAVTSGTGINANNIEGFSNNKNIYKKYCNLNNECVDANDTVTKYCINNNNGQECFTQDNLIKMKNKIRNLK